MCVCGGGGGKQGEKGGQLSRLDLEAYLLPSLNREIWCFLLELLDDQCIVGYTYLALQHTSSWTVLSFAFKNVISLNVIINKGTLADKLLLIFDYHECVIYTRKEKKNCFLYLFSYFNNILTCW